MSGVGVLVGAVALLVTVGLPALAQAPLGQLTPPPPVTEPQAAPEEVQPLPEAWARIGHLFMQLIDARIQLEVERRVDALVQQRLREPLTALEQRLTETTDALQNRLVESTSSLEQRLVEVTNDFRLALDDQKSRIAALEEQSAQLRSQLQAKEAEVARLRSDVQALQRRLWIAIGGAVVALIVAVVR